MSAPPNHQAEVWLSPLAELLVRWNELDQQGWRAFESALCGALRDMNCYRLIPWVLGGHPAPDLEGESETAALRAVLRALERDYDDPGTSGPLTQRQREELRGLRRQAAKAASNRLGAPSKGPITIDPEKPLSGNMTSGELADALGLPKAMKNAVDLALRRYWNTENRDCRQDLESPRKGEPRTLYRVEAVWSFLLSKLPRWRRSSATTD